MCLFKKNYGEVQSGIVTGPLKTAVVMQGEERKRCASGRSSSLRSGVGDGASRSDCAIKAPGHFFSERKKNYCTDANARTQHESIVR